MISEIIELQSLKLSTCVFLFLDLFKNTSECPPQLSV